jgi:hypothetical protein
MSFLFGSSSSFDPGKDSPDLVGKVLLMIGGNYDLGKGSIKKWAKRNPKKIYMGARSIHKAREAIRNIKEEVPSEEMTSPLSPSKSTQMHFCFCPE